MIHVSLPSKMSRWNKEEKSKVVAFYLKSGSPTIAQRQFRYFFKSKQAPTRETILKLTEKFIAEGSVADRHRSGRPCAAVTPEKVSQVADVVKRAPQTSVRRIANEVGTSYSSTLRILKKKLKLRPYKIPVVQII